MISAFGGLFGVLAGLSVILGGELSFGVSLPSSAMADVKLDMLSALMVGVISLVTMAASVYGIHYLKGYSDKSVWRVHMLFNLLSASMTLLVVASHVVLFMVCLELISLAVWLLVIEDGSAQSKRSALYFFLVDHLASLLIMGAFLILATHSHSYLFESFSPKNLLGSSASWVFLLAFSGFVIKAAGIGFHGWLVQVYPLVPSYCSPLISCVMVKIGIYGIIKVSVEFLGAQQLWWGFLVLAFGAACSVLGVMYALAEHNIKKLLAYHTIENVGIILLGVGVSLIGLASQHPLLATLGLLGALYHLLNHALFKGLLCLGSGSIVFRMHTKEMDKMGGLGKTMPITAMTFLIGTLAICALPPFNGFVSEWFIYQSLFSLGKVGSTGYLLAGPLAMVALAFTGALACLCFVKVYGVCFTGAPQTQEAAVTREVGASMTSATSALALLCLVFGIGSPWIAPYFNLIAASIVHAQPIAVAHGAAIFPMTSEQGIFSAPVVLLTMLLLALVPMILLRLRAGQRLPRRQQEDPWACGYQFEQRMTVSTEGMTQPIRHMFRFVYQCRPSLFPIERYVVPLFHGAGAMTHEASSPAEATILDRRKVLMFCFGIALFVVLFFPLLSGVNL
jgi:hydrogenase-4 component B